MRLACALLLLAAPLGAERFLKDDPLVQEPAPRSADGVKRRKLSDYYDFFSLTLSKRFGERNTPAKQTPGAGVDTLGEPMNGSWYERRHHYKRMTAAELAAGPGNQTPPSSTGKWKIISAKNEGITPGFMIEDDKKRRYFIKFDPLSNPEMATAADTIGSNIFHALGYHTPENYIVTLDPARLELTPKAQLPDRFGRARPMSGRDIAEILHKVPRRADGSIRATASRLLEGEPAGPHKYYGTRTDDPNDTIPHEHRRDQRGLGLMCAWLNHDDSRAINSLDMVTHGPSGVYVKHYLIDFGSIMGSASESSNSPRSGFEYLFDWPTATRSFLTFGFAPPGWAFAKFPKYPSVGLFEGDKFDAVKWVPEYPNPAFVNRLPDDNFWAAKLIMSFSNEDLRVLVKTGQYTDPAAENYVVETLIKRRDKIGQAFLEQVLPLDKFRVASNRLEYDDLGPRRRERKVEWSWSAFDNRSNGLTPIGGALSAEIPNHDGYLAASIREPATSKNVVVYLRPEAAGAWAVVGVDRKW